MKLQNNTILITGGTGGVGYDFAGKLLALGNTVIITGRDQAKLDLTKKQLPAIHVFKSDVSDPTAIIQLFKEVTAKFPGLNILINNAGQMRKLVLHAPAIDLTDLTREIETNLLGPIRMVQQFLPFLKTQPSAAILNVTSGLALVPFPIAPIYGASKSGLRSYTKSLRVQLKNTKVKVFELVAPGSNTPLNDQFAGMDGFDEKAMIDPGKIIDAAIKGMQNDELEIYPGIAGLLRIMSRVAPGFIEKQLSKAGAKLMAG